MVSSPYPAIIDMARSIAKSGRAGSKASKEEAESTVREIIGASGQSFAAAHGVEYWGLLKSLLVGYVVSRGLQDELVVKGTPFHWHASVSTKCSAVVLRKDFHRGEAHVEPELYLEAGLLDYGRGPTYGVACGFHYLPSPEGEHSRFIRRVLADRETNIMAWALSNNGLINPTFRSREPSGSWDMDAILAKVWPEDSLPADLHERVARSFDELMPLFRRIIAAPADH
jgi:hypothetical protein